MLHHFSSSCFVKCLEISGFFFQLSNWINHRKQKSFFEKLCDSMKWFVNWRHKQTSATLFCWPINTLAYFHFIIVYKIFALTIFMKLANILSWIANNQFLNSKFFFLITLFLDKEQQAARLKPVIFWSWANIADHSINHSFKAIIKQNEDRVFKILSCSLMVIALTTKSIGVRGQVPINEML